MTTLAKRYAADPSRTVALRRGMSAGLRRLFQQLRSEIWALVTVEDAFGLRAPLTINQRWRFASDDRKVEQFQLWLRERLGASVEGASGRAVIEAYIERAHRQGAGRAFDDTKRSNKVRGADSPTKDQYLAVYSSRQVTVEKVRLLAGRTYTELHGVTGRMATLMTRILVDGLVGKNSPQEIARRLVDEVGIAFNRALLIAHTELVRAHSEGQLDAMEELGVKRVGATVELVTAEDTKVCSECAGLSGQSFSIKEARGVIPVHPGCRCAWNPEAVLPEVTSRVSIV